jgi:hypothetical protein
VKNVNEMTPPIPTEATLAEIIDVMAPDIVRVNFELDSEHPMPRLTVEFMRNVFWSGTFIWVNNKWFLQSFRMDSSEYKKQNLRDIQMTLDLVQAMEGGLQCLNSSQDASLVSSLPSSR